MNTQMAAIIKKDMQSITSNKRMFPAFRFYFDSLFCAGGRGRTASTLRNPASAPAKRQFPTKYDTAYAEFHPARFLFNDPNYGLFRYVGCFLCWRKRKKDFGDAFILSLIPETDFPLQSHRFLPYQHGCFRHFLCRNACCSRSTFLYHNRRLRTPGYQMDLYSVFGRSCHFINRYYIDRSNVSKSTKRRGCPAGCCFPADTGTSFAYRTIYGDPSYQLMAFAVHRHFMRICRCYFTK